MARSKEQIISEMVDSGLFSDDEIRNAAKAGVVDVTTTTPAEEKPSFVQGMFKTYKGNPEGALQKADVALAKVTNPVLKTVQTGLDIANAPFEMAGEAIAAPLEGRLPIRPTIFGGQQPENPISVVNKLLRAGASAVSGISGGTPMDSARASYNAPRGTLGMVEDTAMGLLMGKLAPEVLAAPGDAALVGAQKAISGTKSIAKGVIKKGIRVGLGPTEQAQSIALNRPEDLARQTDFSGLGDMLAATATNLSKKLTELDNQAWDTLTEFKAEPKSKLIQIIKRVKLDFIGTGETKIGNADRQAAAQLDKYVERINAIPDKFLGQSQFKEIVQSIQKDANYSLPESDPVNMAVKASRAGIDRYLKTANPGYEEAMKPVAEATNSLKETVGRFRLENKPDQGFLPTKVTIDRLTALPKDKSPEIRRTIDSLKKVTGFDFADEARLTSAKLEFEPGVQRTAGGRRTYAGGGIGAGMGAMVSRLLEVPTPVGAAIGGTAGTMAGSAMDYYGGSTAKSILDILGKGKTGTGNVLAAINSKTQGSPYQEVIQRLLQGQSAISSMMKERR